MKRRKFIKKSFFGALAVSFIGGLYTWQVEPFWLEFVRLKMQIKNLPTKLKGKTLMQISDIHVGNRFDYQYIIDSFKKAQKLNPDFVVYTGDFVSYDNEEQIRQLEVVLKHAVKGQIGTVAILGNHDYGENWSEQKVADQITLLLEKAGISVLKNEQKNLSGLNIIGLDDYWGLNFNPQKVMDKINHQNANLVLCHNPDVCDLAILEQLQRLDSLWSHTWRSGKTSIFKSAYFTRKKQKI